MKLGFAVAATWLLWFGIGAVMSQTPTPPSVPTGLKAAVISATRIDLTWTASTGGVKGYRVRRKLLTDATSTQIAAMSGTAYSDTGLSGGTSYTYTVSAYDTAGNDSGPSVPVTAVTNTGTALTLQSGEWLMGLPPCDPPFQQATLGAYLGTTPTLPPVASIGPVCLYIVP